MYLHIIYDYKFKEEITIKHGWMCMYNYSNVLLESNVILSNYFILLIATVHVAIYTHVHVPVYTCQYSLTCKYGQLRNNYK